MFIRIPQDYRPEWVGLDKQAIVEKAAALSEEMAAYCDSQYALNHKHYIVLEFEKILWALVLLKKKRYYSLKFEEGKLNKPKIDFKGIELTRRDGSAITKRFMKKILHMVLLNGTHADIDGIKKYIANGIDELYALKLPLSEFVMSRQLSRHPKDYKAKLAHVELAKRLMKDPKHQISVGQTLKC